MVVVAVIVVKLCCAVLCVQVELIVGDIKESVSRVSDVHFIAEDNMTVPSITYEVRPTTRHTLLGGQGGHTGNGVCLTRL
jgi:hypothetical protein